MRAQDRAEKGGDAGSCPKCGKPRKADARECPFCGIVYRKAETPRPGAPPGDERTTGASESDGKQGRIALFIETARRSRRAVLVAVLICSILFLLAAYYRQGRNRFVLYFDLVQEVSGEMIRSAIKATAVCLAQHERLLAEPPDAPATEPAPKAKDPEETGAMQGLVADYEHISALMEELDGAPGRFDPVITHTVKLYELYSQLYGMARRPKGTPGAYEHKVRELEKACMIEYQRIEILLGRLLRD